MRHSLLLLFSVVSLFLKAQIPNGYYDGATGKTGYELKSALHSIIKDHNNKGYSAIWSFIINNDLDVYYENDGTILDIYSENPSGSDPYNFTKSTDQCGTYSDEGDCYNREHSFPKSWFGDDAPMNADIHHIYPTDGKVNGIRSNYPLGVVDAATYTSDNGSLRGAADEATGFTGTVFEPVDEFKGDLARSYFYMATRYQDVIDDWEPLTTGGNSVLDGSNDKVFEDWCLNLLVKWHQNDPVSQKEIDRNNAAYSFQGNRNPFVDHPEYVQCIWASNCSDTVIPPDTTYPNPKEYCREVYFPTPEDKPIWTEQVIHYSEGAPDTSYTTEIYSLIGDTTINGNNCYKVYQLQSGIISLSGAVYMGSIRLDSCGMIHYYDGAGTDVVIYDFSKSEGDTIHMQIIGYTDLPVNKVSSLELDDGNSYLQFNFPESSGIATWIEGVGSKAGLLSGILVYPAEGVYKRRLLCHYRGGQLIYSNGDIDCFPENSLNLSSHENISFELFPVPAKDQFYIIMNEEGAYYVQITDVQGKVVQKEIVYGVKNEISTTNLSGGIFFVSVYSQKKFLSTQKLLLVR